MLWAAALLPDLVRRVSDSRRSDTIGQFSRNLSSLNRAAPVGALETTSTDLSHVSNSQLLTFEEVPLELVWRPARMALSASHEPNNAARKFWLP